MKIITRQTMADSAPNYFCTLVRHRTDRDLPSICDRLRNLTNPIDPDEVDRIIGDGSLTRVPQCNECGDSKPIAIAEIGEPEDYGSNTAHICLKCLKSAVEMLEAAQ